MKSALLFLFGAVSVLSGATRADDYGVPLPRPVVDAIRSKAIVAVFYIDPEQRIRMLEKHGREFHKPAAKQKTMTSKEKKEVYLKSLQEEWAFIDSQRKTWSRLQTNSGMDSATF